MDNIFKDIGFWWDCILIQYLPRGDMNEISKQWMCSWTKIIVVWKLKTKKILKTSMSIQRQLFIMKCNNYLL